MEKIRWSHEAEQRFREIYEYIAQDNPTAAEKVVSGIYDKAQLLSDFPELGHKYREEQEGDIRVLLYGHYRIIKRVGIKLKLTEVNFTLTLFISILASGCRYMMNSQKEKTPPFVISNNGRNL